MILCKLIYLIWPSQILAETHPGLGMYFDKLDEGPERKHRVQKEQPVLRFIYNLPRLLFGSVMVVDGDALPHNEQLTATQVQPNWKLTKLDIVIYLVCQRSRAHQEYPIGDEGWTSLQPRDHLGIFRLASTYLNSCLLHFCSPSHQIFLWAVA